MRLWGGRWNSGAGRGVRRISAWPGGRTVAVVVQVQQLVVPLCYYSDRVLNEGHNDQEAADGGQVARRGVSGSGEATRENSWETTHGLIGSLKVSRRSSTLLVCWRIASSGLCPVLSSDGPPKGLGAAMP